MTSQLLSRSPHNDPWTSSSPWKEDHGLRHNQRGFASDITLPQHLLHHQHHTHHHHGAPRRLLTSTATPTHNKSTTVGHTISQTAFSNYGLLITLDDDQQLCLQFCPDHNFADIHPNSYAPAALTDVHKLGGGGSGVAVFAGDHPSLGEVVMKHGSDKDLTELFALVEVAQELQERGVDHPTCARHIGYRIPAFRMMYISPHHLGEKRKAMWKRLREMNRMSNSSILLPIDELESTTTSSSEEFADDDIQDEEEEEAQAEESFRMLKNCSVVDHHENHPLPRGVEISKSGTVSGHRELVLMTSTRATQCRVKLQGDSLLFVLPEGQYDIEDEQNCDCHNNNKMGTPKCCHTSRIRVHGDGYTALKAITDDLLVLMKSHKWKFTFGQKRIGGDNPKTGNEWLYANQLRGPLLENLVFQKIKLVRDLVSLTRPEEQEDGVLEKIRQEMKALEHRQGTIEATDISAQADAFVGNAIRKNFRAETGRIPVLMLLGERFREHTLQRKKSFLHHNPMTNSAFHDVVGLLLTTEEEIPAYHLGCITKPGALVGEVFYGAPVEPTILDNMGPDYWNDLLFKAIRAPDENEQQQPSAMTWTRLWTCGLADAGLHNLFCTEDRLWLFDLGEPQLASVPGFLTKFMFSFFHTLGMQETASDDGAMWVRRFQPNHRTHRLHLTGQTTKLLSEAYEAFAMALDRIIEELFSGDDSVRWLLLQYVTLQLVSDASFCLQKWTTKGGGRARDCNHQEGLEKWLWRALWDIYVACDINSRDSLERLGVSPQQQQAQSISKPPSTRDLHLALIQELALERTSSLPVFPAHAMSADASHGFLRRSFQGFRLSATNDPTQSN